MNYQRYQKFRKTLIYLWFMVMPITFNLMSPVLIIFAGFEQIINMSFIIFGIWLISSFIFGRYYCSIICQWGAIQEIYNTLIPKHLHSTRKFKLRYIKYPIFVIWIVFILLGPILAGGYKQVNIFFPNSLSDPGFWASFDPRVAVQLIFYFGIQLLLVLPFTIIEGGRSFCNYYCPMGVLGTIGTAVKNRLRYPSLHLEAAADKCTKCQKCTKNCPMSLEVMEMVQKKDLRDVDCILCGQCATNCPNQVIRFAWKWQK